MIEEYIERDEAFKEAIEKLNKIESIVHEKWRYIVTFCVETYIRSGMHKEDIFIVYIDENSDYFDIDPLHVDFTSTQLETIRERINKITSYITERIKKEVTDAIYEFVKKNDLILTEEPSVRYYGHSQKIIAFAKSKNGRFLYRFDATYYTLKEGVVNLEGKPFMLFKDIYNLKDILRVTKTDLENPTKTEYFTIF